MDSVYIEYFKTPLGELILGSFEEKLCLADWRYRKMRDSIDSRIKKELQSEYKEECSEVIVVTQEQLTDYFNGKRTNFDIPLLFIGSEFQKRVWNELLKIPFGETESYLSLSRKLGDEKAIRAVASANGANAISIIVPCHRIIGSNNELTGYAGGLEAKKKLLQLESANDNTEQLNLF